MASSHEDGQASPRPRKNRWRSIALKLCLSLVLGVLFLELLLRFALFSDTALAQNIGGHMRRPELYASSVADDAYWLLGPAFRGGRMREVPGPDPILGWRGSHLIRAETYQHRREADLDGRQPILLFGDSYANCTVPPEDCFQGHFARGPLAEQALLLNYGVGGYGVDQIYLMLREVLKRWDGMPQRPKPIVIVAIMVDDDLDRVILSVRDWPKPRFHLEGDELVYEPPDLAADDTPGTSEIGIRSYLWRWFLHGSPVLSDGLRHRLVDTRGTIEAKRALNARLLREMQVELEARDLEYFFLLFPGQAALSSGRPWGWQEPLLSETFRELGVRHVNAKRDLRRDMQLRGRRPRDYFGRGPSQAGHYTAEANGIALEAIYRGLEGADDGAREAWKPLGSELRPGGPAPAGNPSAAVEAGGHPGGG